MKTKKEKLREAMRIGDRFYYPRLVKSNQRIQNIAKAPEIPV